eukprot:351831-Chlamydomonas_euryale.AAC.2
MAGVQTAANGGQSSGRYMQTQRRLVERLTSNAAQRCTKQVQQVQQTAVQRSASKVAALVEPNLNPDPDPYPVNHEEEAALVALPGHGLMPHLTLPSFARPLGPYTLDASPRPTQANPERPTAFPSPAPLTRSTPSTQTAPLLLLSRAAPASEQWLHEHGGGAVAQGARAVGCRIGPRQLSPAVVVVVERHALLARTGPCKSCTWQGGRAGGGGVEGCSNVEKGAGRGGGKGRGRRVVRDVGWRVAGQAHAQRRLENALVARGQSTRPMAKSSGYVVGSSRGGTLTTKQTKNEQPN